MDRRQVFGWVGILLCLGVPIALALTGSFSDTIWTAPTIKGDNYYVGAAQDVTGLLSGYVSATGTLTLPHLIVEGVPLSTYITSVAPGGTSVVTQASPYTYIVSRIAATYYANSTSGGTDYTGATFATVLNDAITACSYGNTIFIKSGTYVVAATITGKSGVSLIGEGSGTLFDASTIAHDAHIIDYTGTAAVGVALTGNAARGDDHLHLTSTSFTAEDMIQVNADAYWRSNPQNGKQGEFQFVGSVAAGLINLRLTTNQAGFLYDSYATVDTAQVQKITPVKDFRVEGINFLGVDGDTAAAGQCLQGVVISYGLNVKVKNCKFTSITYVCVEFKNCMDSEVSGNYLYLSNMSGNGVGVGMDYGNQNILITGNVANYCRHGVSIGGGGSVMRGIPRNIMVSQNQVSDSWIASLDCHQMGENINFCNNQICGGNRGIRYAAYSGSIVGNSFVGIANDYGVDIDPAIAVDGAIISGNTFNGCYYGIYIASGNNYCITGNVFINDIDAVHIQAGVTNCNIVGNQLGGGVTDDGTGTLIRSNIGQADN
jgi:hypothetical protein